MTTVNIQGYHTLCPSLMSATSLVWLCQLLNKENSSAYQCLLQYYIQGRKYINLIFWRQ